MSECLQTLFAGLAWAVLWGQTTAQLYHEKIETGRGYAEIRLGTVTLISKYNIMLHKIQPDQNMRWSLEKFRESINKITASSKRK